MNQFNKDVQNALLNNSTSLKEIFRQQLEKTVNQLLKSELSAVLGYEAYERNHQTRNARNGSYERQLDTEFGTISIRIPRDRQNKFQNAILQPYARRLDTLETMIIHMYSKGITTREIADLIEEMYGCHYSPTTVSNITEQVEQLVQEFHQRAFKHHQYVCVFLDATYVPLKRGTVEREAINVAIGIRSDGGKEILDYSIAPNENGEAWNELLQGLKERGITDIQLFIADGMVGLQNAIFSNFPQAKFQRCWVHVARNLMGHVRKHDRREIMTDFKIIRQAATLEAAQADLSNFVAKWDQKYHRQLIKIQNYQDLFTFYDFPPAIRNTIYSTNLIESFNKQVKKRLHKKEQFPNEAALDRFFVTQVMDYNDKFENRSHRGFKTCRDTLDAMFH